MATLQDEDIEALFCEVGSGDEPVVAPTDDDGVAFGAGGRDEVVGGGEVLGRRGRRRGEGRGRRGGGRVGRGDEARAAASSGRGDAGAATEEAGRRADCCCWPGHAACDGSVGWVGHSKRTQ